MPFAYSSNGDAFYEHDFLTGTGTDRLLLETFPTQDELIARLLCGVDMAARAFTALEKKVVRSAVLLITEARIRQDIISETL
jgi:type I restriction enzyme R subunit